MTSVGGYSARRFFRDCVLAAVGVVLFLLSAAFSLHFGMAANGAPVEKRGVAVPQECVSAGLFGPSSWGWWETCQADVQWKDGTAERVEFEQSQLTSADVGREVDVVARRITQGVGKGSHVSVYRANFEPKMTVGSLLYWPLMLSGSLLVLFTVFRWVNVVRGWFGLAPWGSKGDEK